MFYRLVKVSFAYLLPVGLKSLCFIVLDLQKDNFVQCYSVLSDFHPMANDDYVTCLDEFSVILFYLPKITCLGEIGKNCSYSPYINLNFIN